MHAILRIKPLSSWQSGIDPKWDSAIFFQNFTEYSSYTWYFQEGTPSNFQINRWSAYKEEAGVFVLAAANYK